MGRIDEIVSILPPKVKFLDGTEYIQHIPWIVEKAQIEFIEYCMEVGAIPKDMEKKQSRLSIVGRMLDGNTELYSVWNRFMCIDELYREWEQPYFSFNYKKYDDTNSVCINNKHIELISYFRDAKIDDILK